MRLKRKRNEEIQQRTGKKIKEYEQQYRERLNSTDALDSLADLTSKGVQVIGIQKREYEYYIAAIYAISKSKKITWCERTTILLFKFPRVNTLDKVAMMHIEMKTSCHIEIVDWTAYPVNHGYGSILMSMVLEHYRNAGYQTISGWLSPVDNDHKERLYHFYRKHGFQIMREEEKIMIRQNLREEIRKPISLCDHSVCIRDRRYFSTSVDEKELDLERTQGNLK